MIRDDGHKSIELFKEKNTKQSNQNIHLIMMDQNMIKMNGDEATKKVSILMIKFK